MSTHSAVLLVLDRTRRERRYPAPEGRAMRTFAVLALLLIALGGPVKAAHSRSAAPPPNLLQGRNPGFEEPGSSGAVPGWTCESGAIRPDSGSAFSGKQSLRASHNAGWIEPALGLVRVEPGWDYHFSVRCRYEGLRFIGTSYGVGVSLTQYDDRKAVNGNWYYMTRYVRYAEGDLDWTEATATFSAGSSLTDHPVRYLKPRLIAQGSSGTVWFDDARLWRERSRIGGAEWTVTPPDARWRAQQGHGRAMDTAYFLDRLANLDWLPQLEPGVRCRQFSSYDQHSTVNEKGDRLNWDANDDRNYFLRVENGEHVMAEMDGPGCITQIWSANPRGTVSFYLDHCPTPLRFLFWNLLLSTAWNRFFRPPLTDHEGGNTSGGGNCWIPIPYREHCKVTLSGIVPEPGAAPPDGVYYHIDYLSYPKGANVRTFTMPPDRRALAAMQRVARCWAQLGSPPESALRTHETIERTVTLPPGHPVRLADLAGPCIIKALRARLGASEEYALRKTVIRIYWDEAPEPAVDCPLGEFFGTSFSLNEYRSLVAGLSKDGGYCFWPMPFARHAHIEAVNQGEADATLWYRIEVARPRGSLAIGSNTGYFHAKWRRTPNNPDFDWPVLECSGRGKFVGAQIGVHNSTRSWWGEGDEKVWVDDDRFPSWFGTGSEDYLNSAWGLRLFAKPLNGCTLLPPGGHEGIGRTSGYRWHLNDSIPFDQSFRMTLEDYGGRWLGLPNPAIMDRSATAYWYQVPGGWDFFQPTTVTDRIPWPADRGLP